MPRKISTTVYDHVAVLTEYERGWGSKMFIAREFPSKAKADAWIAKQNKENTAPVVPDYYIQASYHGTMTKELFDKINSPGGY
jgi:hypothetical protein